MNDRQQRRAERREQDRAPDAPAEQLTRGVALVSDGGGYRLAIMSLPASVIERYATELSEPEIASVQAARAARALEDALRGELDEQGKVTRPRCTSCGAEALVRHPSKPVMMCAACDGRFAVEVGHG